ncbi:MAG TPA: alpha-E domain-containing protein [Acidimicrobiales bacterium]|nr:alpha-E domain-containing protein [Acidimicrobiales bacterium]
MLSRIAESLFWVGRYLERAEDTARILDVQIHQLLEDAASDEAVASRALLSVMGIPETGDAALELGRVTALLAFDLSQPSSIVSSIVGARESARGIRETISSELWECLNATYVALDQRVATARAIGPHAFFRFAKFVKERVAIAAGIADATMSRDDGWRFLVLGRSLERVDMTARLLGVRLSLPESMSDWVTTLRCCSAHEAYLRTYHGTVDAARSTEFLLLDRLFPRSAYFALATAESCLSELDPDRGRLGPEDEARRVLGRARAALEYRRIGELLDGLPTHLTSLQRSCSEASSAVAARYFHREPDLEWRAEVAPDRADIAPAAPARRAR